MSSRKKFDISPQTMISAIETETKALLPEMPKGLKPKLISIQETVKLLSKKINSFVSSPLSNSDNISNLSTNKGTNSSKYQQMQERINKQQSLHNNSNFSNECKENIPKEDSLSQRFYPSQIEYELQSLRSQNDNLKSEISKLNKNLSASENKINKNLSSNVEFKYLLDEERNNNKMLVLQVKTVEDNFKILSEKYNALNIKHQELLKELSSLSQMNSDMKRNTNENKYRYEDLIAMNCELKTKLASYESVIKTHTDDIKILMKKNATLTNKIEELTKQNKTLTADVSYKDERLKAIRIMNTKLEQKSNSLVKKWDSLSKIEQRSNQISKDANEAYDSLKEMTHRLDKEMATNKNLNQVIRQINYEKEKLAQEINKIKEENKLLKVMNKEVTEKCQEMEESFRQRIGDIVKDNSQKNNMVLSSNSRLSNIDNSNSRESVPIEQLQPARLTTK